MNHHRKLFDNQKFKIIILITDVIRSLGHVPNSFFQRKALMRTLLDRTSEILKNLNKQNKNISVNMFVENYFTRKYEEKYPDHAEVDCS